MSGGGGGGYLLIVDFSFDTNRRILNLDSNGILMFFRYMDTSRHHAEEILRDERVPNNTFLVRKQGKNEGHAISIKYISFIESFPHYFFHLDIIKKFIIFEYIHVKLMVL